MNYDWEQIVTASIAVVVIFSLVFGLLIYGLTRASYSRDLEAACVAAGGELIAVGSGPDKGCYKIELTPIQTLNTRK